MQFNKYVWELYIKSEQGKTFIAEGLSELNDTDNFIYLLECDELDKNDEIKDDGKTISAQMNLREAIRRYALEENIEDQEHANKLFIEISDEGIYFESGIDFKIENHEGKKIIRNYGGGKDEPYRYQDDIIESIDALTAGLYDAYPEFFFPYFFELKYNELEKILRFFEIPIPQVPGKLQKRERALYYLEINAVLQDFRKKHRLSPRELNAFLYDFAKENVKDELAPLQKLPAHLGYGLS
ncbi:MAG: hypothetical protein KAQ98_09555 [Bacteriovoracaceae bacterium]|nr:hypothetical protein [Bacteriovoracaceae bacterium]